MTFVKALAAYVEPMPEHERKAAVAAFTAGWKARDRQSTQRTLIPKPDGPAWTPHSGTGATRETSLAAAASVAGRRAGDMRARVLAAIRARPDTDRGIAERTGLAENSVRPRRLELVKAGKVVDCGTRRLPSGRRATVWTVAG